MIVILNEVKNLYPRFADIRDVSATLNMTFLEHFFRVLLIIVILNEVKNLYPRFTDIRDVSATLNMTFLEHP